MPKEALSALKFFSRIRLHLLLFVATFLTTYYVNGIWYSVAIMMILLSHESGHFFMCRKYHVDATMPYFLPLPFPPFGTFGAVIKMKGLMPDKKALFDIGAAGPLIGLAFSIPAIVIGLLLSDVKPVPTDDSFYIGLGEPILFSFIARLIFGILPDGMDIFLHPIAFAGWAGLFVTALNLLPIGQLDGGHIIYALLGKKSRFVYRIGIFIFCVIAILLYPGWMVFAVLLLIFGFRHPAPINESTSLDLKRKILGVILFIIFFVSFTPVPLRF
ncbi:MAG: site-2 protease family protein [Candidatus Loosdrechtia sp.]|uniref:site-2 protease family protein n=1 Tax=Candidatus Loosdrechtia sp. TaxID=3101272 RepID=UPI003A6C931B|nr:MAG: site-2 protease family protein [Candidatus Jettenia sp. AMX2]